MSTTIGEVQVTHSTADNVLLISPLFHCTLNSLPFYSWHSSMQMMMRYRFGVISQLPALFFLHFWTLVLYSSRELSPGKSCVSFQCVKGVSKNYSTHCLVLLSCFWEFQFLAFIFIPTLTIFQCNPPAVGWWSGFSGLWAQVHLVLHSIHAGRGDSLTVWRSLWLQS